MSRFSLSRLVDDTLSSVQFLSRLPVHLIRQLEQLPNFKRSAWSFPLAGLLIAAPAALVLLAAGWLGLDATTTAILTIATQTFTTGALHEDGLADVADGFWGGFDRERKLAIMRDSAIGTYGVLALVITIGLRVALLAAVLRTTDPFLSVVTYLAIESLSRMAILSIWNALPPARPESGIMQEDGKDEAGLSVRYGGPELEDLLAACLCALPAMAMILFGLGLAPFIASLLAGAFATAIMARLANRHVGGHTGDVLGAAQQLALLGLYLGVALAI